MKARSTGTNDRPSILVLGTADWDQRIATNQHYAVRELAQCADVIYVESLGLRRVQLQRRDVGRILRRVGRALRKSKRESAPTRTIPDHVSIRPALVIPLHNRFTRRLNRILLNSQIIEWRGRGRHSRVLWTYTPVTYGLENEAGGVVYHCVDLLGEFPGISKDLIDDSERRLAQSDCVALASSPAVARHLKENAFSDVRTYENVADVDKFRGSSTLGSPQRNGIVFSGNLTLSKVDFTVLQRLLDRGANLHLAGPISEGGGDAAAAVKELQRLGATYHGLLSLDELGALYASCSVGLIPYVLNNYTVGISPLKTYEYLAAGLCVISTPIPSVVADLDVLVETGDRMVDVALRRASVPPTLDEIGRRWEKAAKHSWHGRGTEFRNLVLGLVQ